MPPKTHSLLGGSSAHRWIACPPSARLCETLDEEESSFAAEGSSAHGICEYRLRKSLGQEVPEEEPRDEWYSEEMSECADDYVNYITDIITELKKTGTPIVMVEQFLDYSKYVEDGYGTGDCVIISDNKLKIIDFKYGKGVEVSAYKNEQMLIYALGAVSQFEHLYDIEEIEMVIFQPRLHNVSTYEISIDDLLKWANEVLVPRAKLAFEGKGEFCSGEHCRFCKAKAICRERAKSHMKLADFNNADPALLKDDEIEDILDKADTLVSWANDVKEFALDAALKGKKWKRYKAVEGRSNRKLTDEDKAVELIQKEGLDPYERKLISIGEIQKLLGKVKFKELIEPLITKPPGKPCLVSRDDKRDELEVRITDFDDVEDY